MCINTHTALKGFPVVTQVLTACRWGGDCLSAGVMPVAKQGPTIQNALYLASILFTMLAVGGGGEGALLSAGYGGTETRAANRGFNIPGFHFVHDTGRLSASNHINCRQPSNAIE